MRSELSVRVRAKAYFASRMHLLLAGNDTVSTSSCRGGCSCSTHCRLVGAVMNDERNNLKQDRDAATANT